MPGCLVAKAKVAGSNPVFRSNWPRNPLGFWGLRLFSAKATLIQVLTYRRFIGIRVPPAVLAHAGHIFSRNSRRLTHSTCTRKLCE